MVKLSLPKLKDIILCIVVIFTSHLAWASAYNARLPDDVNTASDLCQLVPCKEVLPAAAEFSHRKGIPSYVEGYALQDGQRHLVGYIMLSTDIVDIPAYSGKPVITLIGMDTKGLFTGIRILKHSEPILLLGIPESALEKFNQQYIGRSIADKIEVGRTRADEDIIGVDAISGATVTVIAQNQVIMTSAAIIGRQVGILPPEVRAPAHFLNTGKTLDWRELEREGSVQKLLVRTEEVGLPPSVEPLIDLRFGYLNQPDIGRAILGASAWEVLMGRLHEGEHAIFVIRVGGQESFKGSGFVRGGFYDRVQVRQGSDAFTFRDLDSLNLYSIAAPGAPQFDESAIFIIRTSHQRADFSAAYPWKFVFLGHRIDKVTGQRSFANFDAEFWLPSIYLEGGRPVIQKPTPPWLRVWQMRSFEIAAFAAFLCCVAFIYSQRNRLARASRRAYKWPINVFKYSIWIISIGFIGIYLMAQPSITQVLTWLHSLITQWRWALFLTDPFLFLFWIFIAVTVILWGRGLFCGWLCPFGSLTELLYKIAAKIGLKKWQFALPKKWHNRLKWVKYTVFFVLLAVSLVSMVWAEMLAEIEPFKTTFLVGLLNRSWPYTLFAAGILALSIFTERPFCKYLCPLGAALAIPTTFRLFGLKRKTECGTCKLCTKDCGSQAIDEQGRIDKRECMLCLDCVVLYTDTQVCPPLAKERKHREREGLALTAINAAGYYIPMTEESSQSKKPAQGGSVS